MSLLDRVRDLVTHPPEGEAWDDQGVEDVAALATSLAAGWDAEPDDHRPSASRAAALGAFAAAMSHPIELRQGAAGRASPPAGAAPEIRRGGRRPALILVTTGFLLAMSVGTVVASAPGGPLYDARIAAEELLLPPGADQRATAQVERLEERVAEAAGAEARGDTAGVSAALRAYVGIATEAAAGPLTDSATGIRLAARVRAELEAISRIGAAEPALAAVREEVRLAVRALLAAFGAPGDGGGPGPGPGPSASSEPSSGATATPRGSAPRASASPEPPPGASAQPRGSQPAGAPGDGADPEASGGPRASVGPGDCEGSSPRATAGPSGSSGTSGTASPRPDSSPRRSPTASPAPGTDSPPGAAGGTVPGP